MCCHYAGVRTFCKEQSRKTRHTTHPLLRHSAHLSYKKHRHTKPHCAAHYIQHPDEAAINSAKKSPRSQGCPQISHGDTLFTEDTDAKATASQSSIVLLLRPLRNGPTPIKSFLVTVRAPLCCNTCGRGAPMTWIETNTLRVAAQVCSWTHSQKHATKLQRCFQVGAIAQCAIFPTPARQPDKVLLGLLFARPCDRSDPCVHVRFHVVRLY